jgi:hypothetical protein
MAMRVISNFNMNYVLIACLILSGCTSVNHAKGFNEFSTPFSGAGKPISHLTVSKMAVHLLAGKIPFFGNAEKSMVLDRFAYEARLAGADTVRLVQSQSTTWWFAFPPLTFLITPVTSEIAGDISNGSHSTE